MTGKLARFFDAKGLAALELECKPFFVRESDSASYADRFSAWLAQDALTDAELLRGLVVVTARTVLEIGLDGLGERLHRFAHAARRAGLVERHPLGVAQARLDALDELWQDVKREEAAARDEQAAAGRGDA